MHSSAGSVPRTRAPRLRAEVHVTVTVHIACLQFVSAESLIEQDSLGESAFT